jgi:GNAT superfamily N-acetyltransferase
MIDRHRPMADPSPSALEIEVVDPEAAQARSMLTRYFAELDSRFAEGFDPDAGGAAGDAAALRPPAGAFVVVCADQVAMGCGGVQRFDDVTGEIKRMWIDPAWRSLGLGRRLLLRLEEVARDLGYGRIVLDTNAALVEAVAMYERAGYCSIDRYNANPYAQRWFAKNL